MPERENYEMYASGSILYAVPGQPAFPVRLASEIFRRCAAFRESWGASAPCTLYDPCCGSAYHLATIAYFNWNRIAHIRASDIDDDVLPIAARNLSLLQPEGLEKRISELASMAEKFGKQSHETALQNALILKQRLAEWTTDHPINTQLFRADATNPTALQTVFDGAKADIVITDIPYGQRSTWTFDAPSTHDANPIHQMLDSLFPVLAEKSVVAMAANKQDKIRHERYKRLDKFQVGKRQVVILQPI